MTRYIILFDDGDMIFPDEDLPDVARAALAVVQEARDAGVWVFGAGLQHQDPSVVATDGTVTDGPYPEEQGAPRRIRGRRRAVARGRPWRGPPRSPSPAAVRNRSSCSCPTRPPERGAGRA